MPCNELRNLPVTPGPLPLGEGSFSGRGGSQLADEGGRAARAEEGRANDERIRACREQRWSILERYTTIDAERNMYAQAVQACAGCLNARERVWLHGLPTETRIDSKDQEQIEIGKKGQAVFQRIVGAEAEADFCRLRTDQCKGAKEIGQRIAADDDQI